MGTNNAKPRKDSAPNSEKEQSNNEIIITNQYIEYLSRIKFKHDEFNNYITTTSNLYLSKLRYSICTVNVKYKDDVYDYDGNETKKINVNGTEKNDFGIFLNFNFCNVLLTTNHVINKYATDQNADFFIIFSDGKMIQFTMDERLIYIGENSNSFSVIQIFKEDPEFIKNDINILFYDIDDNKINFECCDREICTLRLLKLNEQVLNENTKNFFPLNNLHLTIGFIKYNVDETKMTIKTNFPKASEKKNSIKKLLNNLDKTKIKYRVLKECNIFGSPIISLKSHKIIGFHLLEYFKSKKDKVKYKNIGESAYYIVKNYKKLFIERLNSFEAETQLKIVDFDFEENDSNQKDFDDKDNTDEQSEECCKSTTYNQRMKFKKVIDVNATNVGISSSICAFQSLKGLYLLVYSSKCSLIFYDLVKNKKIKVLFFVHKKDIICISHYGDEKTNKDLILSSSLDGKVKVFDLNQSYANILTINKSKESESNWLYCCFIFSFDSSLFVLVSDLSNSPITIYDLEYGELIKKINFTQYTYKAEIYIDNEENQTYIVEASYSEDSNYIKSFDYRKNLIFKKYEKNYKKSFFCITLHTFEYKKITIIIAGYKNGDIFLYNFKDGNVLNYIKQENYNLISCFCRWGNEFKFFVGTEDGTVRVLDLVKNDYIKKIQNHTGWITGIQYIRMKGDVDCFITCGKDGHVVYFN